MNRVARQLKEFMISATMTAEQSAEYTAALKAAGDAENEMMDWMANYKEPVGQPAAEAIKYLTEKKAAIEANQVNLKAAAEAITKLLPE